MKRLETKLTRLTVKAAKLQEALKELKSSIVILKRELKTEQKKSAAKAPAKRRGRPAKGDK